MRLLIATTAFHDSYDNEKEQVLRKFDKQEMFQFFLSMSIRCVSFIII